MRNMGGNLYFNDLKVKKPFGMLFKRLKPAFVLTVKTNAGEVALIIIN